MLPVADDDSDRKIFPIVNYILIAINIFVFVYYQDFGRNLDLTYNYAAVSAEIISGHDVVTDAVYVDDPISGNSVRIPGLGKTMIPVWLTIVTSMFMHGGLGHIGGNMLYLWVFGDNLETNWAISASWLFIFCAGSLLRSLIFFQVTCLAKITSFLRSVLRELSQQ